MDKLKFWFTVLGWAFLPVWVILWWWLWTGERQGLFKESSNEISFQKSTGEDLEVGDRLEIDLTGKVVCSKYKCWDVELATSFEQWKKGLQGVEFLPEGSWMLFVFPYEGEWWFWMSGTLISLDIIWIDQQGKITKIRHWAKPCTGNVCPVVKGVGKYVLEVSWD